ncbi:hypothetical protein HALLA_09685 [Halostagnicola larsenii XH-48]|uniref:Uncharacterized protein n=1 Tax=Halostagnicola larsenii XH-48 TaxID=797299 RepID=W0JQ60_9EURY|nr:hypothetical protein HALLA_09520 [Halostagnicola larsenii XH-48]AHG00856.1 hypothetical protein HALLA_09685 [Halostagnicola larsenii XH-48]
MNVKERPATIATFSLKPFGSSLYPAIHCLVCDIDNRISGSNTSGIGVRVDIRHQSIGDWRLTVVLLFRNVFPDSHVRTSRGIDNIGGRHLDDLTTPQPTPPGQ